MDQELLSNLRQVLYERLNESELRDLCFDLGVDYESLSGEGKGDKARELVGYLQRRKRIPELIMKGEKQRPDILWSHLLFDVKPGAEWIKLGQAMEVTGYGPDYLWQLAENGWVRARKEKEQETDEEGTIWLFDRDVVWFHRGGWISTDEAHVLTGYTTNYLRSLAREEMVVARKIRGVWLMRRDSLLEYCRARGLAVVDTLPPIEEDSVASHEISERGRELLARMKDQTGVKRVLDRLKQLSHTSEVDSVASDEISERERELVKRVKDQIGVKKALGRLKQLSHTSAEHWAALDHFERGLDSAHRAGEKAEVAAALNYAASSYQTEGKMDRALEYYQASLPFWRDAEDQLGVARTLKNIGTICQYQGRMEEARRHFEESLNIVQEVGDRVIEAETLQNLGSLLRTTGDFSAALATLAKSEEVWRELEDTTGLFVTLNDKGLTLLSGGEVLAAEQEFEEALELSKATGDLRDKATALTNLGLVATRLANWDAAKRYYTDALTINENLDDFASVATILVNLGGICTNLRRSDEALEHYRRGQTITRRIGDRAGEATALSNIGSVLATRGDLDEALTVYQQALNILQQIGDRAGVARTQDTIQTIYHNLEEGQRLFSLVVADAQRFFQAAGFTLGTTGEASSFTCQPATPTWQSRIKCDVYTSILVDRALDGEDVLGIREAAQKVSSDIKQAFVLVDHTVPTDAWLQIAYLRARDFNVIPVPLSLLEESKVSDIPISVRMALQKHLRRFLGRSYDPYDVRDPVSDVLSFFGREALARELIEDHLIVGQSVGLFGLRKIGKSSLMKYLQRLMPCPTAWLDLQAGVDLTGLCERTLRAWANDARARLKIDLHLKDRELNTDDPSARFFELTQETLDRLATEISEARLAIFLDEIELLVPPAQASGPVLERYLSLMRTLRGLVQEDGRVSLMVAGVDPSINRVNRWGVEQNPFYQLLQEVFLPPLLDADCKQMIRNIGRQVELSYADDAAEAVAQASGGHPFLARQLCSLAYRQRNQQPGKVSLVSIEEAIDQFIFDPQRASLINDTGLWGELSNEVIWGDQARANQTILLELAKSPQPLTGSAILDGPNPDALRSALFALQQLWVVRPVEDVSCHPNTGHVITFGLLRSWLRQVQLGLEE